MWTITSKKKGDVTWEQFDGTMWRYVLQASLPPKTHPSTDNTCSVIELNFALICSCMPAFKPFLQHSMPYLRNLTSRIYSSQRSTSSKSKNTSDITSSSSSSSQKQDGNPTYHQCKAEFVELKGIDGDGDVERAGKKSVGIVREVQISIDEEERTVHSQV